MHWRNGWPSQYENVMEMPVDVYMGYLYLLRTDQAHTKDEAELMAVQSREQAELERLYKISFGGAQ